MSENVKTMLDAALTKRPREFRQLLDQEIGRRVVEKINNRYKEMYIDESLEEGEEDEEEIEDDLFDDEELDEDDDFDDGIEDLESELFDEPIQEAEVMTRGEQSVKTTRAQGILSQTRDPAQKRFVGKHHVKKVEDANGNKDDVFNASNVASVERTPAHGYNPGEDEVVYEEKMSPEEIEARNKIADRMRKDPEVVADFKKSYGKGWKGVLMATVTKQVMD